MDLIRPPPGKNKYKSNFLKAPFGDVSKNRDQIQNYVVKDHGFPFLKWCGTSQSVKWFGC